MAYATLDFTFKFADNTTRRLSLAPFNPSELDGDTIKENIAAFNSGSGLATVANLWLSDDGASCTGIVDAYMDVIQKTNVFTKSAQTVYSQGGNADDNGN